MSRTSSTPSPARAAAGFRKLLVGPWFLRDGILSEIERIAEAARGGEPARSGSR